VIIGHATRQESDETARFAASGWAASTTTPLPREVNVDEDRRRWIVRIAVRPPCDDCRHSRRMSADAAVIARTNARVRAPMKRCKGAERGGHPMAQTTRSKVKGGAKATTDHDEIRRWVEEHGGRPAAVKRTAKGDSPGILRIDFPGFSGEQSLESIEWDEWFERFDSANLAFLYQDETGFGRPSRFNKLVSRESVDTEGSRKSTRRRPQARAGGRKRAAAGKARTTSGRAGGASRSPRAGARTKTTARGGAKRSTAARGGASRKATSRGTRASTTRQGTARGAKSRSRSGAARATTRAKSATKGRGRPRTRAK
jgi:hypothetical protein